MFPEVAGKKRGEQNNEKGWVGLKVTGGRRKKIGSQIYGNMGSERKRKSIPMGEWMWEVRWTRQVQETV